MSKTIKAVATIFWLISAVVVSDASAQEKQPVSQLMATVKQRMESACSAGRGHQASAGTEHERKMASSSVKLNCDCLPAELDKAAADIGKPDTELTQAEFLAKIAVPLNFCAGKMFRADIVEACAAQSETVLGVSNKPAFCGCMGERLNALSDEAIASNAISARKNFEARIQARREGKPDPGKTPTLIDEIHAACKQVAQ